MKVILNKKDDYVHNMIDNVVQINLNVGDKLDDDWSFVSIITKNNKGTLDRQNVKLSKLSQLTLVKNREDNNV